MWVDDVIFYNTNRIFKNMNESNKYVKYNLNEGDGKIYKP